MCSLGELRLLIAELGIAPLPPEQRGVASTRIAAAAQSLGYASEEPPAAGSDQCNKAEDRLNRRDRARASTLGSRFERRNGGVTARCRANALDLCAQLSGEQWYAKDRADAFFRDTWPQIEGLR